MPKMLYFSQWHSSVFIRWHCWLCNRKDIWPVKKRVLYAGDVACFISSCHHWHLHRHPLCSSAAVSAMLSPLTPPPSSLVQFCCCLSHVVTTDTSTIIPCAVLLLSQPCCHHWHLYRHPLCSSAALSPMLSCSQFRPLSDCTVVYYHRHHTHTLRFNGHFSRWTWVSRLPP